MRKFTILAAVAACLAAGIAVAKIDSQGREVVAVESIAKPDGGVLQSHVIVDGTAATKETVCATVSQAVTSVGNVTAVPVPASALSSRNVVRVCNSPENVGSPKLKCKVLGASPDAGFPVMGVGNVGDVISVDNCMAYAIDQTQAVYCISDVAGTAATSFECAQ